MNIIEYQGAQAVSTDGIHWDIYVRDNELVKDLANSHKVQTSDIRYGSWSEKSGLKRGALYPSDDFKLLEIQGAIVYEYLLQHHQDVPFPFMDCFELWLLDDEQQPLALLSSVVRKKDRDFDLPLHWRPGNACRKSFQTSAITELDQHPADYIAQYINQFAEQQPVAQWFYRDEQGDAKGMEGINLKSRFINRKLDNAMFPNFYIRDYGHDTAHTRLINDFIAWQSPYFLLLHHLENETRALLEQQARTRALIVDELYQLYPTIIQQEIFNAARVEALLRRNQNVADQNEELYNVEYLEPSLSRTN